MIDARMLRIDAHTHVFPEEVVSNRVGFLGRDPSRTFLAIPRVFS